MTKAEYEPNIHNMNTASNNEHLVLPAKAAVTRSARRSTRTGKKRRKILDAAAAVFAREDFEAATMSQIAAEAGVSVGAIYLYFKDREELRQAVTESRAAFVLSNLGEDISHAGIAGVERVSMIDSLVDEGHGTWFFSEPQGKREREAESRRRMILEAAGRVFGREGFHPATISEVAAEAGVAVGTVYLYFSKKEDLYVRLVEEKMDELLSILRAESRGDQESLLKIHSMVTAEVNFFASNRECFGVNFFIRNNLPSALKQSLDRKHDIFIGIMTEVIRQGIDAGDIRTAEPADLANLLQGMLSSMLGQWLTDEDPPLLTEKTDWLVDFFLRAAASDGKWKA